MTHIYSLPTVMDSDSTQYLSVKICVIGLSWGSKLVQII